MASSTDVTSYFQRIGYHGNPKPDLPTLRELQLLHTQSIPFENLNPLLKIPVNLDLPSLFEKIVYNNRGGYCFEQNLLFNYVLNTIGFEVQPLAGRVFSSMPEDEIPAKTHMLLLLHLDGKDYIADVGFGGLSLTAPLELHSTTTQKTPHENYKIINREDYYLLQASVEKKWKSLYRFTTIRRYFIDYKIANWYTSTHPDSQFTKSLVVAIAGNDCRYTLRNNWFSTHRLNEESQHKILTSAGEIKNILKDVFNITPPGVKNLDAVLNSLIEKP